MSITNNARTYFENEKKRAALALENNIDLLKKSYIRPVELQNNNSGEFWDAKFNSTHEKKLRNHMEIDRNKQAANWISESVTAKSKTLNIGSGDGNLEKLIYKLKIDHTGFDIASNSLKKLKKEFPKFEFFRKDILEKVNDKYKNRYEIICMFEVLEHISPKSTFVALSHVSEMLTPGGIFLISVPMNEGLEEMFPYNPNEHLRCYTPELIKKELEIAGFTVRKIKLFYAFSNFYFVKSFLVNYLGISRWMPNNILIFCTN